MRAPRPSSASAGAGTCEDDIPEVQLRAIEVARVGPMPPDLPRWKALGRRIAKFYAIDQRREWEVRKKYDAGLCEEPDAHGPIEIERGRDPVDAKRYLGVLKDCFDGGEMPEIGAEILWGAADEVPQETTAEETGLERADGEAAPEDDARAVRRAARRAGPPRRREHTVRQIAVEG